MKTLPARILDALQAHYHDSEVCLHEPVFQGDEKQLVTACLESSFVSTVGPFVSEFENKLKEVTGAQYVIATSSGTTALHLALLGIGVKKDMEVMMSPLTFVATANAVSYCNAVPHFIDVSPKTLGIDPEALRRRLDEIGHITSSGCINKTTGRQIKAVVPVHTYGNPCDLEEILHVCAEYSLEVIEDAAESLGSYFLNRHTGTFGRCGIISFNGNKIVTTGSGGAILTNDPTIASKLRHLSTTAKVAHRWRYYHDEIGYNYRMSNLSAALGCAQLDQLSVFVEVKRRHTERYLEIFKEFEDLTMLEESKKSKSNYWLQTLVLGDDLDSYRDEVLGLTNANGIMTRPSWELLHQLPMYKDTPFGNLKVVESLGKRIINLPSGVSLKWKQLH